MGLAGKISKARGVLYRTAKISGDAQALIRAAETGKMAPIWKRIGRRLAGKGVGRLIGQLFPPTR